MPIDGEGSTERCDRSLGGAEHEAEAVDPSEEDAQLGMTQSFAPAAARQRRGDGERAADVEASCQIREVSPGESVAIITASEMALRELALDGAVLIAVISKLQELSATRQLFGELYGQAMPALLGPV